MIKGKKRPVSSNIKFPKIQNSSSDRKKFVLKKRPQSVEKFKELANKTFSNASIENKEIHKALKEMNMIVNDLLNEETPKISSKKLDFKRKFKQLDQKSIESEIVNGKKLLEMQNSLIKRLEGRLNIIQSSDYLSKIDEKIQACINDSKEFKMKISKLKVEGIEIEKSLQKVSDPIKNPYNGKIITIERLIEKEESLKKSYNQELSQMETDIESYKAKSQEYSEKYQKLQEIQKSKVKSKEKIKQEEVQKKISNMEEEISIIKHSSESQKKMKANELSKYKDLIKELDLQVKLNEEDIETVKKRINEFYAILKMNGISWEESDLLQFEKVKEPEPKSEINEHQPTNEFIQEEDKDRVTTKDQIIKNLEDLEEKSKDIVEDGVDTNKENIVDENKDKGEGKMIDPLGPEEEHTIYDNEEGQEYQNELADQELPNQIPDMKEKETDKEVTEKKSEENQKDNMQPDKTVVNRSSANNESLHLGEYLNSSKENTSRVDQESSNQENIN